MKTYLHYILSILIINKRPDIFVCCGKPYSHPLANDDNMVLRRPNSGGPPTEVRLGLLISHFGSINEVNMDYQLDIHVREIWIDERLNFTFRTRPLSGDASSLDKIWKPDLFFRNELDAKIHTVSMPNKLVRVYPNGTVLYTFRTTVTASCYMVLKHYPMDTQVCGLEIMSYSSTNESIILKWFDENAIQLERGLFMPSFTMQKSDIYHCTVPYLFGAYSCVGVLFHMHRKFLYYFLRVYLPSTLICALSWIAFWIHREAVPARVTLGVTTVLTMTAQFSGVQAPRVPYANALDVWVAALTVFVFAALLEFAVVNVCERNDKEKGISHEKGTERTKSWIEKGRGKAASIVARVICYPKSPADAVDRVSRWLFPLSFLTFNIIYWAVYTQPHELHKKYTM